MDFPAQEIDFFTDEYSSFSVSNAGEEDVPDSANSDDSEEKIR